MCPIVDGQRVWAATDNAAFLDAQSDDTALGKITLANTDPDSGLQVDNVQKWINAGIQDEKIFIKSGWIEFQEATNSLVFSDPIEIHFKDNGFKNTISASNSPISLNDGDSIYVTIQRNSNATLAVNVTNLPIPKTLDTFRFATRIGDYVYFWDNTVLLKGKRCIIGQGNLDEEKVPLKGYFVKGATLTNVTGSSVDVTSLMVSFNPSTSSTQKGAVVNTPYNKVSIFNASSSKKGDFFRDDDGDIVYGRLTESSGTWTLSFYVDKSGETSYTFTTSSDIDWYFQALYSIISDAPVYQELIPNFVENVTEGVADATQVLKGKVNLQNSASTPIGATSSIGTPNARVANADHTHEGVHEIKIDGTTHFYRGDVVLKAGSNINITNDSGKIKIDSTFSSPLTTKGDIYTRDSSGDARLPVGVNGQILSADSSEPTGLKWIDPPSGGGGDISGIQQLSTDCDGSINLELSPCVENFVLQAPDLSKWYVKVTDTGILYTQSGATENPTPQFKLKAPNNTEYSIKITNSGVLYTDTGAGNLENKFVLKSPNNTLYRITVNNFGAIVTVVDTKDNKFILKDNYNNPLFVMQQTNFGSLFYMKKFNKSDLPNLPPVYSGCLPFTFVDDGGIIRLAYFDGTSWKWVHDNSLI